MMRVLLDTNVVLDGLLDRQPWAASAEAIWRAHLDDRVAVHVSASALTDIFYVARRVTDRETAWVAVRACLDQLHVIAVSNNELHAAVALAGNDFEDNLQIACATAAGLDAIVTRDASGFSESQVEVIEPVELLDRLPADD